jgi:hypothetical protein
MLTSEKLISTPDREKKNFLAEKLKNLIFLDNRTTLPSGLIKVKLTNMIEKVWNMKKINFCSHHQRHSWQGGKISCIVLVYLLDQSFTGNIFNEKR